MQEIYEGTFLEAPESEKGIILLKLDTGYNIGFNRNFSQTGSGGDSIH